MDGIAHARNEVNENDHLLVAASVTGSQPSAGTFCLSAPIRKIDSQCMRYPIESSTTSKHPMPQTTEYAPIDLCRTASVATQTYFTDELPQSSDVSLPVYAILKFANTASLSDAMPQLETRAEFISWEEFESVQWMLKSQSLQAGPLTSNSQLQVISTNAAMLSRKVQQLLEVISSRVEKQMPEPISHQEAQTEPTYEAEWYKYVYQDSLWEIHRLKMELGRLLFEKSKLSTGLVS